MDITYVFLLPSTTRSGTSLEIKSFSDGPSASVAVKVAFLDADGPDVADVASDRTCLGTRATRECMRTSNIVFRTVLKALRQSPIKFRFPRPSATELRAASLVLTKPPRMSTLSRREEDTLFKATKANALKECDELVKGMVLSKCLHRR